MVCRFLCRILYFRTFEGYNATILAYGQVSGTVIYYYDHMVYLQLIVKVRVYSICAQPVYILGFTVMINVTLSHLRSKEFQRIHMPRIPHHRDTSGSRWIPGKWLHF